MEEIEKWFNSEEYLNELKAQIEALSRRYSACGYGAIESPNASIGDRKREFIGLSRQSRRARGDLGKCRRGDFIIDQS